MKQYSKRKRKPGAYVHVVEDSKVKVRKCNMNMNEDESQFIDYLSNAANGNDTMFSEESLLLSPILHANNSRTPASRSTSKMRTRSSARLKRRQILLNGLNSDEKKEDRIDIDLDLDLNASIPEHDVLQYTYQPQNYDAHSVFSPQAQSRIQTRMQSQSQSPLEARRGEDEDDEAHVPHLLSRALDTSACPSLGLGSIGTSNDSNSKADLSHESAQSAHTHTSNSTSTMLNISGTLKLVDDNDNGNGNGNGNDTGGSDLSGGDSGLSFDSESSSEECVDSFQSCIDEEEEEEREEVFVSHASNIASENNNGNEVQCNNEGDTELSNGVCANASPELEESIGSNDVHPVNSIPQSHTPPPNEKHGTANITQSPMAMAENESPKSATTPRPSTLTSNDNEELTPNSRSSTPTTEDAQETVTPAKSIMKIRKGLTPKLKALRSKMIRESLGGNAGIDIEQNSPVTSGNGNGMSTRTASIHKSTPLQTQNGDEMSLTPALKDLRSKLYSDTPGEDKISDHHFGSNSSYNSPIENNEVMGNADAKTPSPNYAENAWSMPGARSESDITPSALNHSDDRLSLTPALKAFRMKMLNSTLSPLDSTPSSQESSTPASRPSMSTVATPGSGRNTRRVFFEEDNSYLGQPKDLSSAKKKLNAQSSALLGSLRGAAYKRVISITKSRDSLAAKESKHFEKHDDETEDETESSLNDCKTAMDDNNRARQSCNQLPEKSSMQSTTCPPSLYLPRGQTGVPIIKKRPTTVPISPKLGARREKSSSLSSVRIGRKHVEGSANTPSIENIGSGSKQRNVSKIKRMPLTIPKSPLLGARRESERRNTNNLEGNASGNRVKLSSAPSPRIKSDSPLGLGFLSRDNDRADNLGEENVKPFTLHSSIRAKERAHFESCRLENEKLRTEEINRERSRILKDKYSELGRLREKLR